MNTTTLHHCAGCGRDNSQHENQLCGECFHAWLATWREETRDDTDNTNQDNDGREQE